MAKNLINTPNLILIELRLVKLECIHDDHLLREC